MTHKTSMNSHLFKLFVLYFLTGSIAFSSNTSNSSAEASWKAETKVVGYFMNWRPLPSQDRINALTHLYLSGYKLDTLKMDGSIDTTGHDGKKVDQLVALGDSGNTKILIMLGGWGNHKGFTEAAATQESRSKLAQQLIDYCLAHGLAGVDLDWEFPETPEEYDHYELMAKKLREEFDKHGLLLTSAKGQDTYNKWTLGTYQHLHWINIMAYDMNWSRKGVLMRENHAPSNLAQDNLPKWLALGIPKEKLVFGVPFYGRKTDDWSSAKTYDEIYADYKPEHSHNVAGGYNYNGPHEIYNKASYVIENNFGGVMIWEIEQDLALWSENSLHRALIQGVEDALEGSSEEKPITKDVNVNEPVSSIINSRGALPSLRIHGTQITNSSSETIKFEIYKVNGQLFGHSILEPGESQLLPVVNFNYYLREIPKNSL